MATINRARSYPHFNPGDEALLAGSFEVVTVKAQDGRNVLVERAGGQATYDAGELEFFDPDFCPLD